MKEGKLKILDNYDVGVNIRISPPEGKGEELEGYATLRFLKGLLPDEEFTKDREIEIGQGTFQKIKKALTEAQKRKEKSVNWLTKVPKNSPVIA